MYDIFFVGDFSSETGPSIANNAIREGLKDTKGIIYSDAKNKLSRMIELIIKILISDIIIFCSSSQLNVYGIRIAKILNKKTFYIMHGYESYEYKMNNNKQNDKKLESIKKYEQFIFKHVDKIFCVSKSFMEFMKKNEPTFEKKFDYNYNGVNLDAFDSIEYEKKSKKLNQIVSIGGGMRRKNNLIVCKAISKINRETNYNLKYIVIGQPYMDKDEICKYDFVTYYDFLPHQKVLEILRESRVYIQNSYLETFGIGVLEALFSGCSLIISQYVGAKDILTKIDDNSIIYNPNDVEEIANKLKNILENEECKEKRFEADIEAILPINTAKRLIEKIER